MARFRQLHLEFGWLPPPSAIEADVDHLSAAERQLDVPDEEVVSVRLLGRIGSGRKKAPKEGTQASHSFDRVKAVAAGEATGSMPPDFYGSGLAIPEPTEHLPGTIEKIDVLAARALARQILFHPKDAVPNKE